MPIKLQVSERFHLGQYDHIFVDSVGAFAEMSTDETLLRVVEVLLALRYICPEPTPPGYPTSYHRPEGPLLDPAFVSKVVKKIVVVSPKVPNVGPAPRELPTPEGIDLEAFHDENGTYRADPSLGTHEPDVLDRLDGVTTDGNLDDSSSRGVVNSVPAPDTAGVGKRRILPTISAPSEADQEAPIRVRRGIALADQEAPIRVRRGIALADQEAPIRVRRGIASTEPSSIAPLVVTEVAKPTEDGADEDFFQFWPADIQQPLPSWDLELTQAKPTKRRRKS